MEKEQDILIIKQLIHQVIPYKKEIIFFGSRARGEKEKGTARKNLQEKSCL